MQYHLKDQSKYTMSSQTLIFGKHQQDYEGPNFNLSTSFSLEFFNLHKASCIEESQAGKLPFYP